MRDLIIVGTGGVGRALRVFVADINDVAPQWNLLGFVDDAHGAGADQVGGLPILGTTERLNEYADLDVLVGIGQPNVRRDVTVRLQALPNISFPPLIHPRAYVARNSRWGKGSIAYPGACVEPEAEVGDFVLINQNATVGHDTRLSNWATLGPGACVGGAVRVGEGVDVGIGASCKQGLTIGGWARVGAGAAVIRDVLDDATVAGVPAKPM